MKLLRSFPILAFSLVLLSMAAVCIAQQSVGLLLIAGTLAAISWYVTEGPHGRILPRWVSNVLVVAVSLNVFVELFRQNQDSGGVLAILGRFGVWLTIIKLYERRTARDYAHLLSLSLVLIMTACLSSNEILLAGMLALYAALGLYVLMLFQLYAAFERSRDERNAAIPIGYRLIPPFKPIIGRHPILRFRGQCSGMAMVALIVSLLVFLAFPRDVGINMFRLPHGTAMLAGSGQTITQFSWNIDLNAGIGGRITESTKKVFDVEIIDESAAVKPPLRFRGAVLNEYQGHGRWSSGSANWRLGPPLAPVGSDDETHPSFIQRFVLEQPAMGVTPVYSAYAPLAVHVDDDRNGEFLLYDRSTQTIKTTEAARRLRSYSVRASSSPSLIEASALTEPSRMKVRQQWFEPNDVETLRGLANQQISAAGLPIHPPPESDGWQWNRQVAETLTNWLHSNEFLYTTDLTGVVYPTAQTDPIIGFLTASKRGHCEFFASALAALCHSKGIPSRIVVGYIAFDLDESTRMFTVLERNAHAWVEVATGESEGRHWTTFDPTPPSILEAWHSLGATDSSLEDTQLSSQSHGLAEQWRRFYQRAEELWSRMVVDYNSSAQAKMASSLSQEWSSRISRRWDSIRDWMGRVNASFYFGPAGYIWMGIVFITLGIAVLALVKLMRRSLAIRRTAKLQHVRGADYQHLLRHVGFYLDMLQVLQRAGLAKPSWQPPLAFAAQLKETAAADFVKQLTTLFYETRYGGRRLAKQDMQHAKHMVQELASRLNVKI